MSIEQPPQPDRPLRADARRNRARVLAAARDAFAEHGFTVPLDAIAERAGVGPGTVYRHFPTKEALFAAVTQARVRDLVAAARAAAAAADPGAAFDDFLGLLAGEARAKRDVPDVLEGAIGPAREEMHAALAELVAAAQRAEAVRAGIGVDDLVALLKGVLAAAVASDDPGLPERLLAVVRDGLRPPVAGRSAGPGAADPPPGREPANAPPAPAPVGRSRPGPADPPPGREPADAPPAPAPVGRSRPGPADPPPGREPADAPPAPAPVGPSRPGPAGPSSGPTPAEPAPGDGAGLHRSTDPPRPPRS